MGHYHETITNLIEDLKLKEKNCDEIRHLVAEHIRDEHDVFWSLFTELRRQLSLFEHKLVLVTRTQGSSDQTQEEILDELTEAQETLVLIKKLIKDVITQEKIKLE